MSAASERARLYTTWTLAAVLTTSIAFAFFLGRTPVMKLVLFLLGLAIWHGILTYAKELIKR